MSCLSHIEEYLEELRDDGATSLYGKVSFIGLSRKRASDMFLLKVKSEFSLLFSRSLEKHRNNSLYPSVTEIELQYYMRPKNIRSRTLFLLDSFDNFYFHMFLLVYIKIRSYIMATASLQGILVPDVCRVFANARDLDIDMIITYLDVKITIHLYDKQIKLNIGFWITAQNYDSRLI